MTVHLGETARWIDRSAGDANKFCGFAAILASSKGLLDPPGSRLWRIGNPQSRFIRH